MMRRLLKSDLFLMSIVLVFYIGVCSFYLISSKEKHEQKISEKIAQKKQTLMTAIQNEAFTNELKLEIKKSKDLSKESILKLDQAWIKAVANNEIENYKQFQLINQNSLSATLKKIRSLYPEFVELFVTDVHGLVIGTTNPTSDFYQADETWWKMTKETGRYYVEHIQYDDSAMKWSIPFSVPIYSENKKTKLIAILKAVLDVEKVF